MKGSLFVIILLLVFQGCEFPLEDENYVEIPEVPKNKITIALEDLPDTVEVFTNIDISYSLDVEGYPAIAVFAVVGDQAEYLGYNYNGMFTLSNATNQITTKGYLPFELVVLSTSRTGSLADRSQRELVLFSEKRVLYFDYSPVKSVNFTKVEEKDGSLFLHWDKYPQRNLIGFWLQKTLPKNGELKTEYIELDKNATSYHDDAYIGTEVEYVLKTTNSQFIEAWGEKVTMNEPAPKIVYVQNTGPNQVTLKWKMPRYFNNATGYQLAKNQIWGNPFYSNSNVSDTTYTLNDLPFGEDLNLFLTTKSHKVSNNTDEQTTVWLGEKKPAFNSVSYNSFDQSFCFVRETYLIKEKDGVRDSVNLDLNDAIPPVISSSGQSIYVASNGSITEVSTGNLEPINTYQIAESFTSFIPHANSIITIYHTPPDYPVINVYDKTSGSIIQTFPLTDIPGGPSNKFMTKLSSTPLSNYILGDGGGNVGVFKVANDGTIESAKFASGRAIVFGNNGNNVYVFDDYRSTYTFPQFDKVDGSEVPLPSYPSNLIYDIDKKLIGVNSSNSITIYDMVALAPLKTIKLTLQSGSYVIKNGVLFVNFYDARAYAYDLGF